MASDPRTPEQFVVAPWSARAPDGRFDEWFAADGQLRPHMQRLYDYFAKGNPNELRGLRRAIRQRINLQEVTFNILGAPGGSIRPWNLDAIPLLMDIDEWRALGRGLRQRARLLSLVHEDIFGPQRLLHSGAIPSELVLGHPALARACFGWVPVGGQRLHIYASDLARSPDGTFRVFSDRTAAPAGAGYALENRLVLGTSLGGLFQQYEVQRVRGFFEALRGAVQELSPQQSEEPRVVLLSAGSHDESSFEHAYLARYLGYELVEGRDLTVRDRVVYLKTLQGLKRVDVILRRIPDAWCDPLALREDSAMGVPGLVDAAAAHNVALANPLGVNVVEAPAMKAYLPTAARELLGEDLLLDSVETLWCGEPASLKRALDGLADFIFKPAFEDRRGEPWQPALMSADERQAFIDKVRMAPGRYVAERWPLRSAAPSLGAQGPYYGQIALRAFLCRDGEDYRVMPGGLARSDAAPDGLFLSAGTGEATKDVWVPTMAGEWAGGAAAMPDRRVQLRRGGLDLPSRLLDDIYWLARHVERCEMTARLLRAGFDRLGSEAGEDAVVGLRAIIRCLEALDVIPPSVGAPSANALAALLSRALLDKKNNSSLLSTTDHLHQLTVNVRSRLSRDAWHVLRRAPEPLRELVETSNEASKIEALDDLLVILSAVAGTTTENMVRGYVWTFLDMGRRVERGVVTLGLVQAMLPAGASRVHMKALLEVADSLMTYRARYLSSLQVAPVVDLLLTDSTNPRSLLFQVERLRSHIQELPRLGDVVRSRAEQRIITLHSSLLTADIEQACSGDGSGLRALLEDCTTLLWQFSDDVTQSWFTHAESSHAMAPPQWIDEELEPQ